MRQLTDLKIKSLKPTGNEYEVKDTQVPGLLVRVGPTGHRSYMLRTRYPGSNNPTRRALAAHSLDEAREKARTWRTLIKRGVDPAIEEERERQAALRKQHITFAAVAEDFIRDKLPSERKGHEVELAVRREFISLWGERPIADITALDVSNVIKAARDRGARYQAHNLLGYAKRLFDWAINQHVYGIEISPCDRLRSKAIIGKRQPRNRVFDDDQWRAYWRASGRMDYPWGPLLRMLALTGQRRSEVAEARWSEFDLTKKLWTIPAERMKAEAAHIVPLTDDVITILQQLPRFKSGDFIFSTRFGKQPVNGFDKVKVRLDKRMLRSWRAIGRISGKDRRNAQFAPFKIHDVRRSMRTGLSAIPGISDLVRELVIGHTKPGLHKVYDQYAYLDEKRHALELWAQRLRNIVEPPPPNVIALQARTS